VRDSRGHPGKKQGKGKEEGAAWLCYESEALGGSHLAIH